MAVRSALLLADDNGLTRLAVPAISMGVYGYPAEEAVPIVVGSVFDALSQLKSLQEIRFVVATEELRHLFQTEISARC